jgi:hypothetical protein
MPPGNAHSINSLKQRRFLLFREGLVEDGDLLVDLVHYLKKGAFLLLKDAGCIISKSATKKRSDLLVDLVHYLKKGTFLLLKDAGCIISKSATKKRRLPVGALCSRTPLGL